MLAIAYENRALTDEPDRSHDQRALVGLGKEPPHEINGERHEGGMSIEELDKVIEPYLKT